MKLSLVRACTVSVVVSLVAAALPGCKDPQTAQTVEKDVFTAEQVACALNNATLDNAAIATACGIASALLPSLQTILSAHRNGVGVTKTAACR